MESVVFLERTPCVHARALRVCEAVAVVVLVAITICLVSGFAAGHCRGARRPAGLAERLAERGWTVSLSRDCGYCHKQVALLPGFRRYVLYGPGGAILDGYTRAPPVGYGALPAFPYWYNTQTGEARAGLQDAAALGRMAAGAQN